MIGKEVMKKRRIWGTFVLCFAVCLLLSVRGEAAWKQYSGGKRKYYVTSTKTYVKGQWYKIKGKWFYFDKNGWLKTGRFRIGNDYYYCNKTTGKVTNKKVDSYYYGSDGTMLKNGWAKIGKKWFFFGKNGKLCTGQVKWNGQLYYCDKKNGKAAKKRIGDYYYGADGAAVKKCWVGKYYYGASGKAKYGQFTVGGQTYYCKKDTGKVISLWVDRHYYGEDGVMAVEQWVGDSYVDGNGTIIKGNKNPKNPPSKEDIRLLAAITYLEAGNQSYYGKQCVASVVVNRVESKKFPNTLKGVIYQSGQFQPAYQIKSILNGSRKVPKKIWNECLKAAEYVLTKGSVLKKYYYFNNFTGKKKIGDHYFS